VAVITLACAASLGAAQAGDTKPFKEIGLEPFVSGVTPGSFQQQLFVDAREMCRTEVWAGVILQSRREITPTSFCNLRSRFSLGSLPTNPNLGGSA